MKGSRIALDTLELWVILALSKYTRLSIDTLRDYASMYSHEKITRDRIRHKTRKLRLHGLLHKVEDRFVYSNTTRGSATYIGIYALTPKGIELAQNYLRVFRPLL